MSLLVPISFLLNALVGVFLLRFAGDDLFGKDADPNDDRDVLFFMLWEGAFFLVFGVAGLIFV